MTSREQKKKKGTKQNYQTVRNNFKTAIIHRYINGLDALINKIREELAEWLKNKTHIYAALKDIFGIPDTHSLKSGGMEKDILSSASKRKLRKLIFKS